MNLARLFKAGKGRFESAASRLRRLNHQPYSAVANATEEPCGAEFPRRSNAGLNSSDATRQNQTEPGLGNGGGYQTEYKPVSSSFPSIDCQVDILDSLNCLAAGESTFG